MIAITGHGVDSIWNATIERILTEGRKVSSRDGDSTEIVGFSATLLDPDRSFLQNSVRALSPIYASAELLWYTKGTRSIDMIQAYAPQYKRFSENNEAYGAYGHRWVQDVSFVSAVAVSNGSLNGGSKSQIAAVIKLLKEKPDTRQAIVTMWSAGDLVHAILGDHKDLPCTLSLQFILRDGSLDMITTMRSNDAWLGLPYDIYCFTCMQRLVAEQLGAHVNRYIHNVGSMHVYERNRQAAEKAIEGLPCETPPNNWATILHPLADELNSAASAEAFARFNDPPSYCGVVGEYMQPGTLLYDTVLCCAAKWYSMDLKQIQSPALRKALQHDRNRR